MDKMKKMLKKRGLRRIGGKRGFTLVELLIVMTIIAILVAIVVMSLTGFIGAGKETVCDADKRSLQSAVTAFWIFNGADSDDWPTADGSKGEVGRIFYTSVDDAGNIFKPDYVIEVPQSDGEALWTINADGLVYAAGTTGPCATLEPSPTP